MSSQIQYIHEFETNNPTKYNAANNNETKVETKIAQIGEQR